MQVGAIAVWLPKRLGGLAQRKANPQTRARIRKIALHTLAFSVKLASPAQVIGGRPAMACVAQASGHVAHTMQPPDLSTLRALVKRDYSIVFRMRDLRMANASAVAHRLTVIAAKIYHTFILHPSKTKKKMTAATKAQDIPQPVGIVAAAKETRKGRTSHMV
jgi:hypothetical protein